MRMEEIFRSKFHQVPRPLFLKKMIIYTDLSIHIYIYINIYWILHKFKNTINILSYYINYTSLLV